MLMSLLGGERDDPNDCVWVWSVTVIGRIALYQRYIYRSNHHSTLEILHENAIQITRACAQVSCQRMIEND